MKWNINVVTGLSVAVLFTASASLIGLSIYLEKNRTVELPPPCEVHELSPRYGYGLVVLHIPNAFKCGTPAVFGALNAYMDFSDTRADIRNFQIVADVERAGYLITFDSPNDYWRPARQK
jgi:hypothetical protein